MDKLITITPVKDSLDTTKETIEAITSSSVSFPYYIFNDFSGPETKSFLEKSAKESGFNLINMEDITDHPSPNYKLALQISQQKALENNAGLLIIESDVKVKKDTIEKLLYYANTLENCGMVAAVTVDHDENINFPYNHVSPEDPEIMDTNHSLSFCCTLLTPEFLKRFDFSELAETKDWYDVFISRSSIKLGFHNYLITSLKVLHQPHSSRPWKHLKYSNPLKYYFLKFFKRRDRI
ncbi:MAG: glycosyltransferase family 2 protein [Bacteroidota bacterium]|nr:glycosyltransferase family 2 protein [Bacteroidota bacterium]